MLGMPKRGPQPKPTALVELEGNTQERRLPENEPKYGLLDVGPPPEDLPSTGKALWAQLGPVLAAAGVLQVVDQQLFYRYCFTWAKWMEAKKKLEKTGDYYPLMEPVYEPKGKAWVPKMVMNQKTGKLEHEHRVKKLVRYPQVSDMQKWDAAMRSMENEMGLTPAARSRIVVAGDNGGRYGGQEMPDDPFEVE